MGLLDPKIEWYDESNTTLQNIWELGTIKAGSASELNEKTFLIWNNRGGTTARLKAYECKITTQDSKGNMTIPLVKEKWVQLKCVSMGETDFTPIGADEKPAGSNVWIAAERPIKATGSDAAIEEILGNKNNGDKANGDAQNCFSEVKLRVEVPRTAIAEEVTFLVRLYYTHS